MALDSQEKLRKLRLGIGYDTPAISLYDLISILSNSRSKVVVPTTFLHSSPMYFRGVGRAPTRYRSGIQTPRFNSSDENNWAAPARAERWCRTCSRKGGCRLHLSALSVDGPMRSCRTDEATESTTVNRSKYVVCS